MTARQIKPTQAPDEVALAEAAVRRAKEVLKQCDEARTAAVHTLDAASHALHNARVKADKALPQAVIRRDGYRPEKVAVIKRTKATVTTRNHGDMSSERQWRRARDGMWRLYSEQYYDRLMWLELHEVQP